MSEQNGDVLSDRELEILKLVATGVSNKEIANQLTISPNTVKVHLRNIFTKIGLSSRTEAAMYAVRIGLVKNEQVKPDSVPADPTEPFAPIPISVTPNGNNATRSGIRALLIGMIFILIAVLIGVTISSRNDNLEKVSLIPLIVTLTPTSGSESRWSHLPDMPTAKDGMAGAYFDNKIFAVGGETDQGITGEVAIYDLKSNTWTLGFQKPEPVRNIQAAVIGGKLYVPGGLTTSGLPTNVLEIYSINDNAWSTGSPMPQALSDYALCAYEGNLILLGGWNGKTITDSVFLYNPIADQWQVLPPLQHPRAAMGSSLIGSHIFLIGGRDERQILQDGELYSLADEKVDLSLNPKIQLPQARQDLGAVTLVENIFVIGGTSTARNETIPFGFQYSQPTNQWGEIERSELTDWTGFGSTGVGTNIYMFGGLLKGIRTRQFISYQAISVLFIPLVK